MNRISDSCCRVVPGSKALIFLLAFVLTATAGSAFSDTTSSLSVQGASATVTGTSPVTMDFPIVRTGDASYDAWLFYATQDGTAKAGVNYTAAAGRIKVPAGATHVQIPVTILGSSVNHPDKTFTLSLTSAVGVGPPPNFAAPQTFTVGSFPLSDITADLNGDGLPDLIVANHRDNTVSVLMNTMAPGAMVPSFAPQQTFAVGADPTSVVTADLNGDGRSDLVVADSGDDTVSVLMNTTAPGAMVPSFAPQQTFAVGADPTSVGTADLNGDGRPDLVVADSGDDTVSVLMNTTAPGAMVPSFAPQQTLAVGADPTSVVTADLAGNGRRDLIVADSGDNTVSVLMNTTAPGAMVPSFAPQQTFGVGADPVSVTTADLNGNGRPDLIVANADDSTVSVLMNTALADATIPSFAFQQTFAVGADPTSVTAADLNGNGRLDLVVANADDSTVSVLMNITAPGAITPSFSAQQAFAVGSHPESVTAVDLTGDAKPALIVANANDNTVSVLMNTTPPPATPASFAAQQSFAVGTLPQSVATADFNGDGKPDLIAANANGGSISALVNVTPTGAAKPSFAT